MRSWLALADVVQALGRARARELRRGTPAGFLQAIYEIERNVGLLTTHEHVDRDLVLRECERSIRHADRYADTGDAQQMVRLLVQAQCDIAAVRIVRTVLTTSSKGAQM